jgi:hypothetical protein
LFCFFFRFSWSKNRSWAKYSQETKNKNGIPFLDFLEATIDH